MRPQDLSERFSISPKSRDSLGVQDASMNKRLDVLLVEDSEDDEILISRALRRSGYEPFIKRVDNETAVRDALASRVWSVILSDYMLPGLDCPRVVEIVNEVGIDAPLIALSGTVSEEVILQMLRAGARDYVMKDNLARLPSAIEREMNEAEGRRHRKRLEAQLVQAQKMEAIGRLAGGVAHDFNNLLTVITGFAQLALLEDNPARNGLEQILQASERAAGLTRQLLAFSRQQAMETRVFDLNQLVRDIERMLRRLIGEDIEVKTELTPGPLLVRADSGQIEQVLLNLAVNSRDAMPNGGIIAISTKHRILDADLAKVHGVEPGSYCAVAVSDNGSGIPQDVLPHIFEPFYTTKPAGKGTGLGLSTAYGIAQQSGGALSAYSEPEVGTTITLLLPSVGANVAIDSTNVVEEPIPQGHEVILISEDDRDVLNMVSEALSLRGFTVLRADGGNKALEILKSAEGPRVQVLVTDIVMPGMPGPQLADHATKLFPSLKILFMSGYTEDVISHHGIQSGGAGFIQKPFAPGALVRKVRQLIDGKMTNTA